MCNTSQKTYCCSSAVFCVLYLASNVCLSIKAELRLFFMMDLWERERLLGSYTAMFTNDNMDYMFTSASESLLSCSAGVCCFGDDRRGGATQMKRERVHGLFVLLHMWRPAVNLQQWKTWLTATTAIATTPPLHHFSSLSKSPLMQGSHQTKPGWNLVK